MIWAEIEAFQQHQREQQAEHQNAQAIADGLQQEADEQLSTI